MASATLTELLPVAAIAGAAWWFANSGGTTDPPPTEKSKEQKLYEMHMADMKAWGTSAAFYAAQHNKHFSRGKETGKELAPIYSPESRTFHAVCNDHATIAAHDNASNLHSKRVRQGEIRMSRRNPIIQTLTPTVSNPKNPRMTATFDHYYENVPYANPAQVKQVERRIANDATDERLRRYYGTALWNRANGHSFRFSEL